MRLLWFFFFCMCIIIFLKCLMLLFKNLLLFLVKLTGNQDCKQLVRAWLGAQSCGDPAGVEEGWDVERGRRRTSNHTRVDSDCAGRQLSLLTGTVPGPGEIHGQPWRLDSEPGSCSSWAVFTAPVRVPGGQLACPLLEWRCPGARGDREILTPGRKGARRQTRG